MSDHTEAVQRSSWPDRVRRGLAGLVAAAVAGGVLLSGPVAMAAPPTDPPSSADSGADADRPDHRKPKEYTGEHREPGRPKVWPPVGSKPGKHRDPGIFGVPHVAKHVKRGPVTRTLVKAKNKVTGQIVSVWLELDSKMSESERNQIIRCVFKCLAKKYFGGDEENLGEISGKTYAQTAVDCLATCLEERRQRKGKKDDDGDTGGTPAKKDPKKPVGPSSGVAKTPTGTASSTKTSSTTRTPVGSPVRTGSLPVVGPKVRMPLGVRGGRGGDMIASINANVMTQAVIGDLDRKREQWYQKALQDPKLRDQIIADHDAVAKMNQFERWGRAFDDSKPFPQDISVMVGPRLIEHRNALAAAEKVAKKSNADPLYQRARRECAGYDTCVKDRVKKLRDQNVKDIAKADRDARKSNADPLYQQARRECGGYDTCVKDRVKKLRAAKKSATPTKVTATKVTPKKRVEPTGKKIDPAVAKKQYEAAAKVCGGYDTCVKDRLAKVRGTGTKAETVPEKQEPKKAKASKKTKK